MLGIDTVMIDGVYSRGCAGATIEDGIAMDKFNFVAISDGMDWHDDSVQDKYVEAMRDSASGILKRTPFEMTDLATFKQVLA